MSWKILQRYYRGRSALDEGDHTLRNVNVDAHGFDHREAHHRRSRPDGMRGTFIWSGTGLISAGFDQRARIDETAGNDTVERGHNSGVGYERLQLVNVGL